MIASKVLQDNFMLIKSWEQFENGRTLISQLALTLIGIGAIIFIVALAGGFYFSYRKAKRKQLKIWNTAEKCVQILYLLVQLVASFVYF